MERMRALCASLWPQAQVKAYGSYATGLRLPTSDLDLVICVPMAPTLSSVENTVASLGDSGRAESCTGSTATGNTGELAAAGGCSSPSRGSVHATASPPLLSDQPVDSLTTKRCMTCYSGGLSVLSCICCAVAVKYLHCLVGRLEQQSWITSLKPIYTAKVGVTCPRQPF